jgi:hypothetical protein
MGILRVLRHGPLIFWVAVVLALGSVSIAGLTNGDSLARASTDSEFDQWSAVESWRASLSQLPLLASSGEVSGFANSLASAADRNAKLSTSSGNLPMASAWKNAASSARRLTEAEQNGQESIQAAVREVGLAGDRLASVASGSSWVPADLPKSLNLLPGESEEEPSSEDVEVPVDRLVQ